MFKNSFKKPRVKVRSRVAEALTEARKAGRKLATGRSRPMSPLSEINKRFDFGRGGRQSSKFWDILRDGVSVSSISTWLQCREQFRLKYVEGWEGFSYSFPIEFGQLFHWLHEKWVRGEPRGFKKYSKEWLRDHSTATPQAREQQEVGYAMAAAIWPVYEERYGKDLDREWVSTEERFDIPMMLPGGEAVKIKGYMDAAWRDNDDGLWLHEMKTKSRIDPGQIEDALWLDLQVMTYLAVLGRQWGAGLVAGVQYDVVRRPASLPHKDEPLSAYTKRLRGLVEAEPEHYFTRIDMKVEPGHVELFVDKVLVPILQDMLLWVEGTAPHYPTPDALVGKYGPCDMYQAMANHNFTGLRRKTCESKRKPRRG